jgi:signal transduction histidine kinase/CheY-like chemotaxis protein
MTIVPTELGSRASRLTRLYIMALSAVAGFSIAGQLLVQWSLARQRGDATVVNIAGRQRMLSQRLVKAALALDRAASPPEAEHRRQEIAEVLSRWRRADRGLKQGDQGLGLPGKSSAAVDRLLSAIEPDFRAMAAAADSLLAGDASSSSDALDVLLAHEASFLFRMDEIVHQYEHEATQRVAWLRAVECGLLMLTLTVLGCEGWFVFRPVVGRLRAAARSMEQSHQQMAAAKQLAESANQAKSQFLATISHELRNPLQAILGSVDLASRAANDARQHCHLTTISTAARALLVLVNDLLDLARMDAGKLDLVARPFEPVALTERTIDLVRSQAMQKQIQLDSHFSSALPRRVTGDEIRIQQVLLNLLNNAIKFTAAGSVTVRLTEETSACDHLLRWEVRDTGVGVAEEDCSHIFESFTRLQNAGREDGAGLGLAICKRLVGLMRGEMGVSSRPDVGSTFWFQLPLATALAGSPDSESSRKDTVAPRRLHVLVVDDDAVNRNLIAELTALLGHDVARAANGSEALSQFRQEAFDVALVDWQMPDMTGGELADQIRGMEQEQLRRRALILALSAVVHPAADDRTSTTAIDHWLLKPVDYAVLERHLGKHQPLLTADHSPELRWSQVLSRLDNRRDLLKQLAASWCAELPCLLSNIKTAAKKMDATELARLAHVLAGQASNFEAPELVSVAKAVEDRAVKVRFDPLLLLELEQRCSELVSELSCFI